MCFKIKASMIRYKGKVSRFSTCNLIYKSACFCQIGSMKQNQPFGKSTFLCKDEIFISCHHKSFISKLFRDKEEEKSLEIKKLKCEKITKSNFRLFWGRGRGWPHGTVDGLHASQPAATGSILSNPEIFKKMSFRTQRFENGRCQLGSPKKNP